MSIRLLHLSCVKSNSKARLRIFRIYTFLWAPGTDLTSSGSESTTLQKRRHRSKLQVQFFQSISSLCQLVYFLKAGGTTQELNLEVRCQR